MYEETFQGLSFIEFVSEVSQFNVVYFELEKFNVILIPNISSQMIL